MQYQDSHISTCSIKKTLVIFIHCTDACASYPLLIIYLFVLSYSLLIVHLFCSLFDYLFCFHFIDSLLILFEREKNNSDPELCSGISILLPVQEPVVPVQVYLYTTSSLQVNKHHTADSTDFVLV
jgi:hypothetical protein